MKFLKKYEESKKDEEPNFKEGDYVICIDNEDSVLTEGERYLIRKIFENKYGYVCKVTSKLGKIGETLGTFSCDRFKSEIEIDTQKYNL